MSLPGKVRRLGEEIDALGNDTAALRNRGAISTDELASFLLDAMTLLKATYQMTVEKFENDEKEQS